MGTVFVTVAGQHGNNAENFYNMFPAEPVLPTPQILQIENVVRVSQPSLFTLLRAIVRQGDRDIVVVSHGVPTQLAIRVMPGIDVGLDAAFVNAILGSDSNAILARRLRTNVRKIAALRTRIHAVQQLNLQRLELRACRVGASSLTLEALKRLFGASVVSAPRVFDGYGGIRDTRPETDAAVLSRWQRRNPNYQTFGTSPNRFFWVNNGSVDPPGISNVFAESWAGVRAWVEAKFASGTNHTFRSGTFYYHIQTDAAPDSSSIHGSRTFDSNFVFPTDSGYWQNLTKAGSAPTTSSPSLKGASIQGRGSIGLNTQYAVFNAPQDEPVVARRQGQYRIPGPAGMDETYS